MALCTFVWRFPTASFGRFKRGERRSTSWRALHNPSFRYYFAGSVTSDFGTWLQNTAQVLLAYRLSHSVVVVGLVTCAQFSSPLILGPWAGVMTNKFGGRPTLIAAQLTAAAFAALMAALAFAGPINTWWLGCGAIASGLAFTFSLPARNVTVRRLVPAEDIRPAFAMDSVSYNMGRAVAPPISVLLVTTLGYGWAFAGNAVSFLAFVGCMLLASHGQPAERRERSQLGDGFAVSIRDRRIAVLLLMVAAVTVADDPVLVLGPALAEHLHVSLGWSGWFIAALGGGTVFGSVLPSRHTPSLRLAATALAALAVCMMLFVLLPWVWGCFFAAFGAGVTCLIANSETRAALATRAGQEHEASVMAVWAIAWAGSKPLASLSDGLLAGGIGIKWTGVLLATPALMPIVVLIAMPILVMASGLPTGPTRRLPLVLAGYRRLPPAAAFQITAVAASPTHRLEQGKRDQEHSHDRPDREEADNDDHYCLEVSHRSTPPIAARRRSSSPLSLFSVLRWSPLRPVSPPVPYAQAAPDGHRGPSLPGPAAPTARTRPPAGPGDGRQSSSRSSPSPTWNC